MVIIGDSGNDNSSSPRLSLYRTRRSSFKIKRSMLTSEHFFASNMAFSQIGNIYTRHFKAFFYPFSLFYRGRLNFRALFTKITTSSKIANRVSNDARLSQQPAIFCFSTNERATACWQWCINFFLFQIFNFTNGYFMKINLKTYSVLDIDIRLEK